MAGDAVGAVQLDLAFTLAVCGGLLGWGGWALWWVLCGGLLEAWRRVSARAQARRTGRAAAVSG